MATPIISMHWMKSEDGSYGVELLLTGLVSQAQAEAAMRFMESPLCGNQIPVQ